jgi:hypothetical protein
MCILVENVCCESDSLRKGALSFEMSKWKKTEKRKKFRVVSATLEAAAREASSKHCHVIRLVLVEHGDERACVAIDGDDNTERQLQHIAIIYSRPIVLVLTEV